MGDTPAYDAFRARLAELGYAEGRNLQLIDRWSPQTPEESDRLASEIIAANPEVIVTLSAAIRSVLRAKASVPIVFAFSGDPVVAGIVESYARPGRNVTGLSMLSLELVGKRMELLRELKPGLKRVAIIANPEHAGKQAELAVSQAAAKSLGIAIDYFELRTSAQLQSALPGIMNARSEAILVFPDASMMLLAKEIGQFSIQQRIPAISGWSFFAEAGNVLSYGPSFKAAFGRIAEYVDKILKGAKAAEMPVELPTTLELCVNAAVAKAMGFEIPRLLRVRADRVIE